MQHKFEDLHTEVVKHLCEMFISDPCLLRGKKSFINDPQLDHLIFEIFVHQLWGKPAFVESIAEFLNADKAEQDAFDDRLRNCVYDILHESHHAKRQTV